MKNSNMYGPAAFWIRIAGPSFPDYLINLMEDTMNHNMQKPSVQANYKKANTLGRFKRESLPTPEAVLTKLGIKPKHLNKARYFVCLCPFHDDKNPSFHIHSVKGNYKCYSCCKSGGDILDFYQAKTGRSFIEAAKDLGAWEVNHERY